MFNKFFKFLKGYVIIEITGKNTARFINICARRGIKVYSVEQKDGKTLLCIKKSDFYLLRPIAKKTKTAVRIREKAGLYHFAKLHRKRYLFAAGLFMFILFISIMSQYIWVVEINGVEISDYNTIAASLEKCGVKSGALKRSLPLGTEIKQRILNDSDSVAWAWVYIEGAKARVEIYEKTLPPIVFDRSAPCSIAASRDGVIKSITVKNGEELLKAGDAVAAGDVIISGKVGTFREGDAEKYMYVHALGDIEAYTSHNAEGEYKLYYESRVPTGEVKTYYSVELFGKKIDLFINGENPYENYEETDARHELTLGSWGYTGIALTSKKFDEVLVNREPVSMDTVLGIARDELEERIAGELMPKSQLLGSELGYEQLDEETIRVKLNMSFIENIGTEVPAEE